MKQYRLEEELMGRLVFIFRSHELTIRYTKFPGNNRRFVKK